MPAPSSRRSCCCCGRRWRTSINRFAEAMTLFAAGIAGIFPILHLGRPWFFYWLVPYPNIMNLWPQWRSPLVWDFFAISTYLLVSLLFWYVGLIPDLATLRDRAGSAPAQRASNSSMACSRLAGAAKRAIGRAMKPRICCWQGWRRRWWCRCIPSCRSISRSAIRRAITRPSSRRTSSPARCFPASRWC